VRAQILILGFRQKRKQLFSNGAQFREHFFFLGQQRDVDGDGSLAANQPRFYQRERQMKAFQEGDRARRLLLDAVGVVQDGSLHGDQVGNDFASGPSFFLGTNRPSVSGNGIRSAQQFDLCAMQVIEYWPDIGHACRIFATA